MNSVAMSLYDARASVIVRREVLDVTDLCKVTAMVVLCGQHAKIVATHTHTECWTNVHAYVVREVVRSMLVS